MIDLPFTINFTPLPKPSELGVYVDLESTVGESKHKLDILLSPLEVFANIGNVGGLSGNQFPPNNSLLNLLSSQQISEQRLAWSLSYRNIDPLSINVLMNILHFSHLRLALIRKVSITASQDTIAARQIDKLPSLFRPLPFAFIDEREGDETDLTIEIHFQTTQPDSILIKTEDAFGHWFSAASSGAFCSSTYTPDLCKIYLGDEPVYAGNMLIIYIEKMLMDDIDSTNSLLNVFQWVHAHVVSISEIRFSL